MRILLDQAVHDHRNKGNNSLLEVALSRFRTFWPEATFEVISNSPHFCRVYLPGTHPVFGHNLNRIESKIDALHQLMPIPAWRSLFELREGLRHQQELSAMARGARSIVSSRLKRNHQHQNGELTPATETNIEAEPVEPDQAPAEVYRKIADYDLYVPTGGGYMCDSDKRFLFPMFDRFEAAVAHGVPTVMVGQGIGPMADPDLLARAKEVLPLLDYIMIREERIARPLLDSLNVPRSKVIMTGDDAIELAYQGRTNKVGTGIGLSLRIASYTQVNEKHIAAIRPIVLQAAQKYNAELVAAPIDANDADMDYIKQIMQGYGQSSADWQKFATASSVINRIGRCRLMIAGTFHGAVFALGQGIPVVALAKTVEYYNKLSGLAPEFGQEGCQIINLNEENLHDKLSEAIDFAWTNAEQLRPQLLAQAERQISLSRAAYQKIFDLVESKQRAEVL